jgi:hypothetical protein
MLKVRKGFIRLNGAASLADAARAPTLRRVRQEGLSDGLRGEGMIYIGVDVGKSGGVAILDGDKARAFVFDRQEFAETMRLLSGERVFACVERVGNMPSAGRKQGGTSMFTFGKGAGFIEGVLTTMQIPFELALPQTWKKEFGLIGKDKAASVEVCQRLFPSVNLLATERSRKPHDGMAEALLIAEYGRRKAGRT